MDPLIKDFDYTTLPGIFWCGKCWRSILRWMTLVASQDSMLDVIESKKTRSNFVGKLRPHSWDLEGCFWQSIQRGKSMDHLKWKFQIYVFRLEVFDKYGVAVAHCNGNWLGFEGLWVRIPAFLETFDRGLPHNTKKWFPVRKRCLHDIDL